MIHLKKFIFSTLLFTTALQCMENQQVRQQDEIDYSVIQRSGLQQNQQGLNQGSFLDGSVNPSILDVLNYNGRANQQQQGRNGRQRQERNNQQQNQSNITSTINNTQQSQEEHSLLLNENSVIRNLTGNNNYDGNLREGENPEFYFGYNSKFPKMLKGFLYLPNSPRSNLVREAGDEYDVVANELRNLSSQQKRQAEEQFIISFGRPALAYIKKCQDPKEIQKRAKQLEKEFYDLEDAYDQLDKDYNQLENRFFRLKDHFNYVRSKKNELQVKIADDAKQQQLLAQQPIQEQPITGKKKIIKKGWSTVTGTAN